MPNRILRFAALLILFLAARAFGGFAIELDHATFRAGDSTTYLEVYAAVQHDALVEKPIGDSVAIEFTLLLDILSDIGKVRSDTFSGVEQRIAAEISKRGQFYPHVFRYVVKPGHYKLRALLFQAEDEPLEAVTKEIDVGYFSDIELGLSDIELGSNITEDSSNTVFVKNEITIIPNPTCFYGTELPMFYFYCEAYGLSYNESLPDSFSVMRTIVDSETGMPARNETLKMYQKSGISAVISDGFPVYTLRTGTYYLEIKVTDMTTKLTVIGRKKFFTFRPGDFAEGRPAVVGPDLQARLLQSDAGVLEIIEPDSALALMHHILTTSQERQIKSLNAEGRRQFLRDFWRERETLQPDATNNYFARVAAADERFTFLGRRGYKTDRGRVFILYGEPDLIDRNYADATLQDHEVWQYERLNGGVFFVFVDRSGYGDLVLVHSTMRGEIYNPNWSRSPTSSGSSGLRE